MDAHRLQRSFAVVQSHGDRAAQHFYAFLFVAYPELRDLFPVSMAGQREKLLQALGHVVSHADRLDQAMPYLEGLGRDHRKFSVVGGHYAQVGQALLATLEHFLGEQWTHDLAAEWAAAYDRVSGIMLRAAEHAARSQPAWWTADVLEHERRGTDLAVFTVRPTMPLYYRPGQSVSLECALRPRVWRLLSPANTPRADGTIEFHVRAQPGGELSPALVHQLREGDQVRLGAPVGRRLTLTPGGGRDLLLIAAGTGLAPLRALAEQVEVEAGAGVPPRSVHLFLGARSVSDLYDLPTLRGLEAAHRWLTVVPVTPEDHGGDDVLGAALRTARLAEREVYVCGPPALTGYAHGALAAAGVPASRIHIEEYDGGRYLPSPTPAAVNAVR
ncbi:globin domain-containing protein [Catellatospora bangladeshensis]|uniref:nitric oxide dioxygenase n=1 Tax=Catellatospora bangladeshensis TaxID=310355 RepID=A0A8J3JWB0_9ACTN|nr:globin domain-containing protein [Catellatospora bangladeshensis]GIF86223.1 oxidoreductase [Catellatospora bangladeshensis]